MLFVDADDEVLIRRFESVRRPHPLQGDGRLADGIAAERVLLAEARETADVVIDTSHLNVNQLRARVEELFGGEDSRRLRVTVLSFGFKYGLPPDADFVVDARFLPNPYWVPDLRELTGRDEPVSRYVLGQRGATAFVETFVRLINATVPGFEREGKRYLTVAVGCTGGKHRSVAIAEELAAPAARQSGSRPAPSTATWGASEAARRRLRRWARPRGDRCGRCGCCGRSWTSTSPRWSRSVTTVVPAAGCGPSAVACRRATCGRPWPPWPTRTTRGRVVGRPAAVPVRRGRAARRPRGGKPPAHRPDGAHRRPGAGAGPGRRSMVRAVGRVLPMSRHPLRHRGDACGASDPTAPTR